MSETILQPIPGTNSDLVAYNSDLPSRWNTWRQVYNLDFNLVPCGDVTKKTIWKWGPNDQGLPNWQEERQTVRFWWQLFYDKKDELLNIAMITGERSGVVAIDGDNAEACEMIRKRCPATPMMTRTSRGVHYFYRHPGFRVGQILGVVLDGKQTKIDIKGDGNYVLAPGSSGKEWVERWTPEMMDSLPVYDPAWLPHEGTLKTDKPTRTDRPRPERIEEGDKDHDELIAEDGLPSVPERCVKARAYMRSVPGRCPGNNADGTAYRLAMTLVWGFLLPHEDALDLLQEWGERDDQVDEGNRPYPWSWKECEHKIRSALRDAYRGSYGDRLGIPEIGDDDIRASYRELRKPAPEIRDVENMETIDPTGDDLGFDDPPEKKTKNKDKPKPVFDDDGDDLLTLSMLKKRADAIQRVWCAENWIQAGYQGLLAGRAKHGKSTLCFDLCTAIITGQKWMNCVQCYKMPVLVADYENPEDYVTDNLFPMLAERGVDPSEVDNLYHCIDPDKINKVCAPLAIEYAVSRINRIKKLTGYEHGVMLIDTARPAFNALYDDIPDWENKPQPVRNAIEIAREIARQTGWAVIVIHHTNKAGSSASGSGDWEGASDYVLTYNRDTSVSPNLCTLSYIGRSAHPPSPIQYVKSSALLTGITIAEKKTDEQMMKDAEHKRMIRSELKRGKDKPVKQGDLFDRLKTRMHHTRVKELLVKMFESGEVETIKGEKNAILYWLPEGVEEKDEG